MKDRLCFVHVGVHKTGTTALQEFCSKNKEVLKKRGHLYPGAQKNHFWLSELLRTSPISFQQLAKQTANFLSEIEKFDGHIILSTEGFSAGSQTPKNLCDFLRQIGFPPERCRIILYARRQDYWLESAYKQQVTQPNIQANYTFSDFIMEERLVAPNYFFSLSTWSKLFGKENISANVYEKQQLPEGIFKNFVRNLELPWSDDLVLPTSEESNVGMGIQDINLLRILNRLKLTKKQHVEIVGILRNCAKGNNEGKKGLLSPRARLKILKRYEASNANAAKTFFGRKDGRLFHDPVPNANDPWQPIDLFDKDEAIRKLVEVICTITH